MIHYTLLPEKEIKILKREYRTRLVIFMLFFMSYAVLVGIISLAPAYILSYNREKEVLSRLEELKKDRQDNGQNTMLNELASSTSIINKIKERKDSVIFSTIISQIIDYKPVGVTIKSFDINLSGDEKSSIITMVIQGKALTRESLVSFKNKLSTDPMITNVELPVSDLAKSKDISYSIKININQIK